jgi:hypothetical protein
MTNLLESDHMEYCISFSLDIELDSENILIDVLGEATYFDSEHGSATDIKDIDYIRECNRSDTTKKKDPGN